MTRPRWVTNPKIGAATVLHRVRAVLNTSGARELDVPRVLSPQQGGSERWIHAISKFASAPQP